MHVPFWVWATFVAVLLALLAIDLLAHRRAHVIGFREAAAWTALWVGLGVGFAFVIWAWQGPSAAGEYTAVWLLEKSLSVDNLFVFALIFGYFRVPREYQHRVLFYGVLGALVLRFAFIVAGVALLHAFHAVLYIFGAFLLYTAFKMLRGTGVEVDPARSRSLRLMRKVIPVTDTYEGQRFLLRRNGVLMATPLLAVLVAVETADVLFAVDSVPAALAVTDETFLVYSANALAILGLRSLYFLLSGALDRFHHLGTGLGVILAFIGVKMLLSDVWHIPVSVSLAVIAVVLAASLIWSLVTPRPADGGHDAEEGTGGAVAPGAGGDGSPPVGAVPPPSAGGGPGAAVSPDGEAGRTGADAGAGSVPSAR
ncbi:MAG: TerC family protein [Frankia sp.]|nr:TerC family protein [Frankia sp.]